MSHYQEFKSKVRQDLELLEKTVSELRENDFLEASRASRWQGYLDQARFSLEEPLLRMGVVGSVKSGKSTLINTLLGTDLLKRGAGIVTAFITRVRAGEAAGGWVDLKPWPTVLEELNAAARMTPVFHEELREKDFLDLRRQKDRRRLETLLKKVQTEWQQTRGRLDPNFILLKAYLQGYENLWDVVEETPKRLRLDAASLGEHQRYVGDESHAVYIQDMELHYPMDWLGDELEIADCQGSDSPNPNHLALLQQYLLRSHFILYVVSSRTGLREADFKLLDFIKTLRMFPQTFFILNVDMDSHPHREDMEELVERVETELRWIIPEPQVFAFSALYSLVDRLGDGAASRDRRRLELWREEQDLAAAVEEGFRAFKNHLSRRVALQRSRILMESSLGRLSTVAGAVSDRTRTQERLMDQNEDALQKSVERLKKKQEALHATLGTLENAIRGLKDSLKRELDASVREHFDLSQSSMVKETLDLVDNYPISPEYLKNLKDPKQLVGRLHRFYQDFRGDLSRYLVEKVNLRIIELAKELESFLQERLEHSSKAFWSLFTTAREEYRQELEKLQIDLAPAEPPSFSDWIDPEQASPPPFSAFVEHEGLGRGALLVKFGLGRLTRFLSDLRTRWGNRKGDSDKARGGESIEEAIRLIKSETRSELIYAFRDYRNNFKFAYLFKLLEEACRRMEEEFKARAEMSRLDLESFQKHHRLQGQKRQSAVDFLAQVRRRTEAVTDELEDLRQAMRDAHPDLEIANPGQAQRLEIPSASNDSDSLLNS